MLAIGVMNRLVQGGLVGWWLLLVLLVLLIRLTVLGLGLTMLGLRLTMLRLRRTVAFSETPKGRCDVGGPITL